MSHDSNRTRIWFPMFSYFESSVDGIIPNEYNSVDDVVANIFGWIICAKDCCMLTARRFWVAHNHQFGPLPKSSPLNNLFGGRSLAGLVLRVDNVMNEAVAGNEGLADDDEVTSAEADQEGARDAPSTPSKEIKAD